YGPALRRISSANPDLVGTWVWTQNGGPLRAGPMSLYPLEGFWLWTDANVYASSQLALDPERTPADLAGGSGRPELTGDSTAVAALTELLLLSSNAVEQGYYIRPFAAAQVSYAGYELPPLLWIMEWDIVGGWSAVWSVIYKVIMPRVDEATRDGFAALTTVGQMKGALTRAEPGLAGRPELAAEMRRSLDYEASLFTALAWYRVAFLAYYRWLDTGDPIAYARWQAARPQFEAYARAHMAEFDVDRNFPAFHFELGIRSAELAGRAVEARWVARALLVGLALTAMAAFTIRWLVGAPGLVSEALWRIWVGAC